MIACGARHTHIRYMTSNLKLDSPAAKTGSENSLRKKKKTRLYTATKNIPPLAPPPNRLRSKTPSPQQQEKTPAAKGVALFKLRVAESRNLPSARVAHMRHFAVNVATPKKLKCALGVYSVATDYSW